jgi:hypothetical protein
MQQNQRPRAAMALPRSSGNGVRSRARLLTDGVLREELLIMDCEFGFIALSMFVI